MTIALTKFKTQVIWRSAAAGDKTTSIPGSVSGNKGFELDIKSTLADGSTYIVTPTSGTIGGSTSYTFTEPDGESCNLQLVSDADNADWLVRCLCCVPTTPFTVGAVAFRGQTFLWNFPAMADSPEGSISFWIKTERNQIPFPGNYIPDLPDGDVFDLNRGFIIAGPADTNFDAFFIGQGSTHHHLGNNAALRQVNPILNITSTVNAVITFTHPHGIPAGAFFLPFAFNQATWVTSFNGKYLTAVSVSPTQIATDLDTTGFPAYNASSGGPNNDGLLEVYNAPVLNWTDATRLLDFSYDATLPISSGVWVNVLASWQTNHVAGTKVASLYYGDTLVNQDGSFPAGSPTNQFDIAGSFTIPFSTPSASEEDSWMIGGSGTPSEYDNNTEYIVCDMAEFWFGPGQYIDFSDPANRHKFHNATTGKPVSLGADGSLPTGTAPILYQSVPSGAPDPYTYLGLPLRFVNPQNNGASMAGSFVDGIVSSQFLVMSVWIWGGGYHLLVDGTSSIELDAAVGTITFDLFDVTTTKRFKFSFPVPSTADVFNVAVAVDTDHPINSKVVQAYVNNVPATVTKIIDNSPGWGTDWTGGMGFIESNGFLADFWLGPGQFFDPLHKFMDAAGAWIDIGADGAGANGSVPSIYLSVRGSDPASALATNRGGAGALTQNGPFLLVPDGAVFLKNLSGNRNLLLNSGFTSFPLATTSPTD